MTNPTTTKTATMRRTSLSEQNNGRTSNRGRMCRYTGATQCWAIDIDGFGDDEDWAIGVLAFDRKWVAEQFVEWFNAEMGDWDGRGCPEMAFKGSDAGEEYRLASWDGKAKLIG
jgi:hypothetical protein